MITAKEFYTQRSRFAEERNMLNEQIFRALVDDEWIDDQGIILSPDEEVCSLTRMWLSKYGWTIQDGHIVAEEITDKLSSEPPQPRQQLQPQTRQQLQPQLRRARGEGVQEDELRGLQPDDGI